MIINQTPSPLPHASTPHDKANKNLGYAFMQEMMKHINTPNSDKPFSGGIGEDQFRSLLNDEYAKSIAAKLDISLLAKKGT